MAGDAATPLLALERLEVAYGGIQAVRGIDLVVGKGELVCLIGANGAGKTTTLKGITGLQPVSGGKVRYEGEDVTGAPAFQLVRRGLAMVPEGRGVFGGLTIEENLAMGAYTRKDRDGIRADIERVFALFPRLKERRRQTAGTLSGGEQQMLAMGRAMMSRPRLLLLDEPSMGLAPLVVRDIMAVVRRLRDDGRTVLLVEQNARAALAIAVDQVNEGLIPPQEGLARLDGRAHARARANAGVPAEHCREERTLHPRFEDIVS